MSEKIGSSKSLGPENEKIDGPSSHDPVRTDIRTINTGPTQEARSEQKMPQGNDDAKTVKVVAKKELVGTKNMTTTTTEKKGKSIVPTSVASDVAKAVPKEVKGSKLSTTKSSQDAGNQKTLLSANVALKPPPSTPSTPNSAANKGSNNSGNDRVTVDESRKSLVPTPNKKTNTPQQKQKQQSQAQTQARPIPSPHPISSGRASPKTVSFSSKIAVTGKPAASPPSVGIAPATTAPPALKPNTEPIPIAKAVLSAAVAVQKPQNSANVIVPKSPLPGSTAIKPKTPQPHKPSVSAPKTQQKQPQKHPSPSPAKVSSTNESLQPQQPVIDDALAKLRAPLVDKYGPYIQPNDTSLQMARDRLKAALDQTRMLRASFTDRVYKKYRVILKPVAKNVDSMIDKIKIDPVISSKKLEDEIRSLKQEKDIEKKEAQKINSALAANNADGNTPPSQQETADQLAFIGAGLSLVILPEEDISEYEIDPAEYPHRGPTNPETGSRVGGISAAAAAAAEVLLDRTRRSGAMRMERNRRRQLQLLSGEDVEAETDGAYSHLHLLSTTARPTPVGIPVAGRVGAETLSAVAASAAAKAVKRVGGASRTSATAFPATPPPPASAKTSRSRAQAAMSGSNLLSLNPNTEELMSSSGRPLASTSALVAKGVGSSITSRSVEQQRWKHPHPDSLGGRRVALTPSGKAGGPGMQSSSASSMSTHISLGLPPLPTARERKNRKPIPAEELSKEGGTERARIAIRSVLEHFYVQDGSGIDVNGTKSEATRTSSPEKQQSKNYSDKNTTDASKKVEETTSELEPLFKRQKRRSTEIGLLRGMQRDKELADIRFADTSKHSPTSVLSQSEIKAEIPDGPENKQTLSLSQPPPMPPPQQPASDEQPIDPRLAFSVLHALGITHEAPRASEPPDEPYLSRLLMGASDASQKEESEYTKTIRSITSQKQPFSEEFLRFVPDLKDEPVETAAEDTGPDSSEIDPEKKKDPMNKKAKGTEVITQTNSLDKTLSNPDCPVASIRGGGEILVGSSDDDSSEPDKHSSSDAARASQQQNHASVSEIVDTGEAPESWSEFDVAPDRMHSYSPARAALSNGVGVRMQGQQQYAHHSQHPIQLAHGHPQGPEMEYFGPTANFVAAQQEWAAASAAAAGFLPSAQSSIAALEYSSRRAALVSMTVRERAARALIAREQAHAAAVHRHAAAAAVRSGAAVAGLSPQQAAVLMGAQSGHGYQSSAAAARFAHMGARNAAAMMNQQAGNPSMMGMPAPTQTQVQAHAARAQRSQQEGRKRVNPTSSPARAKAASKGKKDPPSSEVVEDLVSPGAEKAKTSTSPSRKRARASSAGSTDSAGVKLAAKARASSAGGSDSAGAKSSSVARASSGGSTDLAGAKSSPILDLTKPAMKPTAESAAKSVSKPTAKPVAKAAAKPAAKPVAKAAAKPAPKTAEVNNKIAPKSKATIHTKDSADQSNAPPPLIAKKEIVVPDPKKKVPENISPKSINTSNTKEPKDSKESTIVAKKPTVSQSVPEASTKAATKIGPTKVATPVPATIVPEEIGTGSSASTSGMRFFVPKPPSLLNAELTENVIEGRFHVAVGKIVEMQNQKQELSASQMETSLIKYLLAVGTAVPIPKALVSNPLKERLNTPGFKNTNSGVPHIPREVVVATIMVWLWQQHKESFQRAFAKSGRIDVDPECKWLIHAAVDSAVRALMVEIADAVARGGALSSALNRNKPGSNPTKSTLSVAGNEADKSQGSSAKNDSLFASIVSEALMAELCIDKEMDTITPCFQELVELLDQKRVAALEAKCQERALLATLVSRCTTMSEPFSHAYLSSMVRAGEALGHEKLFDVVQDEDAKASTMIVYDIFSDESGAWEDPCRMPSGFTPNLTGEDLTRRAHARAMIQKSLKKLQDRHHIRGGTPNAGPYTDPPSSGEGASMSGSPSSTDGSRPGLQRSSSGLKRKASFGGASDTSASVGTGAAQATNMTLYNPNHYSTPMVWDNEDMENMPYGRYSTGARKRSLSLSRINFEKGGKKSRSIRSNSVSSPPVAKSEESSVKSGKSKRSTEEINWTDVAEIFQDVLLPGPTTPTAKRHDSHHHAPPVPPGTKIIAPFCRKFDFKKLPDDSEGDDSEEEDLSDETIIAKHRVVLDRMKKRLDKFMEARQKVVQKSRTRGR